MKRWLLRLLDKHTTFYCEYWIGSDLDWMRMVQCSKCKANDTHFRNDQCSDCFVDELLDEAHEDAYEPYDWGV